MTLSVEQINAFPVTKEDVQTALAETARGLFARPGGGAVLCRRKNIIGVTDTTNVGTAVEGNQFSMRCELFRVTGPYTAEEIVQWVDTIKDMLEVFLNLPVEVHASCVVGWEP
jgi:hypothetical protein